MDGGSGNPMPNAMGQQMWGNRCHCPHLDALYQQVANVTNITAGLQRLLTGPGGTDERLRQAATELHRLNVEVTKLQTSGAPQTAPFLGSDGLYSAANTQGPANGPAVHLDGSGRLPMHQWVDRDQDEVGRDYSRIFDDKLPTTPDYQYKGAAGAHAWKRKVTGY